MTDRYQSKAYRSALSHRSCDSCKMRRFSVCQPLSEKQIHALHPRWLNLEARSTLYLEGSYVANTYILHKGWMLLYRFLHNGKRHIVWIALPGDSLELPSIHSSRTRYSALAVTTCELCSFLYSTEAARRWPGLALRVAAVYSERMTIKNDYLTLITHGDARERVVFLALDLYERLWRRGLTRVSRIPFPLTQEDIGDTLGISVVHVNRVLHQLAKEELLFFRRHEIVILDYPRLCEIVGFMHLRSR